jgi:hypothetical protein
MSSADPTGSAPRKRSIFELIADIPTLVTDLVSREIELVKTELIAKIKALGIGAGLIAVALTVLLIVAVIIGLIGYRILKKGVPPVPTESIDSIKRDIRAIKGIGKRGAS